MCSGETDKEQSVGASETSAAAYHRTHSLVTMNCESTGKCSQHETMLPSWSA